MKRARLLAVTMLAVAAAGCLGPRTAIVLPECVKRIEIQGQHSREGERKIILDHTFDLPLSRVEVTHERFEGGKRVVEQTDIMSSRPDLGHLIVGAGIGGVGAVLLSLSASQVVLADRSPLEAQPFYAGLFGASALVTGVAVLGTGWHPPGDTVLRSACVEEADAPDQAPYGEER